MAELILEEVSRVYSGSVRAVDRINLEVHDQEFLVLVGPSGCGKTTTLRLVAGLEQPDAGQVRIGSRVVNDVPSWRRNAAMVFQHPALYPHLDVRRNIGFALRWGEQRRGWRGCFSSLLRRERAVGHSAPGAKAVLAMDRASRHDSPDSPEFPGLVGGWIDQVAQWLGIGHLLERRPSELSGGQRQRVALARAIVRRPEVFLLDEPLSNLDPQMRVEMRRLLAELHGRLRTTTCYVTHDQAEALTLGERVAVMSAGRIEQVGTPRQVYDQPRNRFVAEFIGSPAMSLLAGRLEQSAQGWRFLGRGWALSIPAEVARKVAEATAGSVLLGVRAESILPAGGVIGGSETGGSDVERAASLPARVNRVELLGSEQVLELQLECGAESGGPAQDASLHKSVADCVTIKVPARLRVQPGEQVRVRFDFQRVWWFDPASGANLLWESK